MEDRSWIDFMNFLGNRAVQDFNKLLEFEQEVIQNRRKWEFEFDEMIKQLYRLKRNGLLD